jgi:hypothetical protein
MGMAILAAAIFVVSLGAPGARAQGSAVAITGCDAKEINEAQTQLRDWEKHPPRSNDADGKVQRLTDLQDEVQSLGQERGILDAVCPASMSRAPYFAEIAATQAWAYALEADMALSLGPPCPTAANAIPNQLVASAWFALAGNVNDSGTTAPTIAQMAPKVQARAALIGLTLPAFADTSKYWLDQVAAATKAAIASCNLPEATPSPSPTPVSTPNP